MAPAWGKLVNGIAEILQSGLENILVDLFSTLGIC